MPTYDYECRKCGNVFQIEAHMEGKRDATCPKCRSADTFQLFIRINRVDSMDTGRAPEKMPDMPDDYGMGGMGGCGMGGCGGGFGGF
jgi:putative FmdB family regulatory protein